MQGLATLTVNVGIFLFAIKMMSPAVTLFAFFSEDGIFESLGTILFILLKFSLHLTLLYFKHDIARA